MIRAYISRITLLLLLVSCFGSVVFGQKTGTFVQVIIYDIIPGKDDNFKDAIAETTKPAAASRSFVNERLLRNLDELASQYATYTKFSDRKSAEQFLKTRLEKVKDFCIRTPETHLVKMTDTYYGLNGYTKTAKGLEFGKGKVGQVAHIGLFIPFPDYRQTYDSTLREIKLLTQKRASQGYLGEDLTEEVDLLPLKQQSPYSPRATVPSRMSINYGEYETFENAEDSYVTRNQNPNPKTSILQRNFFSVLQVPTRFYIFKVISNRNQGDIK